MIKGQFNNNSRFSERIKEKRKDLELIWNYTRAAMDYLYLENQVLYYISIETVS